MKAIAETCPGHMIKSQQRDEPDLTQDAKEAELTRIFEENPASFLRRFRAYLQREHLIEIKQRRKRGGGDDAAQSDKNRSYEVEFLIKEISEELDEGKKKTKIKNRRYAAMKSLGDEDFFRYTCFAMNMLLIKYMLGDRLVSFFSFLHPHAVSVTKKCGDAIPCSTRISWRVT